MTLWSSYNFGHPLKNHPKYATGITSYLYHRLYKSAGFNVKNGSVWKRVTLM